MTSFGDFVKVKNVKRFPFLVGKKGVIIQVPDKFGDTEVIWEGDCIGETWEIDDLVVMGRTRKGLK